MTLEVPRELRDAAKAELRLQGKTLHSAIVECLEAVVRQGPLWRKFVAVQAGRPEAEGRGRIARAS